MCVQLTWMTSPVYTVFAQHFLPPELWVPFFNLMQFITGVSKHPMNYSILRDTAWYS